jgi:uncharacterized protein YbaP (TraB family)
VVGLAALAAGSSACGGAQSGESSEEREARQAALIRQQLRESWTPPVLLWQVAVGGTGESEPSWIMAALPYGATLHDALPAPHDQVIERATRVVVEVDPAALELPALYETHRLGRRERLDRMLGAAAWGQLRSEMGQLLPDTELRQLRPWVMAVHVARIRMAEAEAAAESRRAVPGAASTASVTGELLDVARTRGVETATLDSDPAAYIADIEAIAPEHWVLALREELESADPVRARMGHLREAFESRDENRVREACAEGNTLDPEAAAQLRTITTARATRWLAAVEQHARRGSTLIAVDACTLLVENGLLAQLYGTGLRIQRLGAPPGTERP